MSSLENKKILLVGCGKMGSSLLDGWLKKNLFKPENVTVIEPSFSPLNNQIKGVKFLKNFEELKSYDFDLCVFAIKPQAFKETLPKYKWIDKKCIFVSIAAGKSVATIESLLGDNSLKIVRAMPNLPASVGAGFTGYFRKDNVSGSDHLLVLELFKSCGEAVFVNDENDIDKITAVSGSGPAYFYYLIECLQKASETLGFSTEHAQLLAEQTAIGAIELLKQSGNDAKTLRESVTSKGGTTEAGLNIMKKDANFEKIVESAVNAAFMMAKELND